MANRTDYSRDGGADRLRGTGDALGGNRTKDAGDRIEDIASGMAEQARQYGEKAQDAARQFKPFVEKSLKDQPMATLAGAAAIGFILGALWKR
jgi:ElaB/YqjD/DUF883 family membrane-anchored ribosome-binding protein